jgi:hypothetical protein
LNEGTGFTLVKGGWGYVKEGKGKGKR